MKAKRVQMELESSTLLGAQFPLWLGLIISVQKESLHDAGSYRFNTGATSCGIPIATKQRN